MCAGKAGVLQSIEIELQTGATTLIPVSLAGEAISRFAAFGPWIICYNPARQRDRYLTETDMTTVRSLLAAASPSQVTAEPFPHVVARDALPSDLYGGLQAAFPSAETVLGGRRETKGNAVGRLPAAQVLENAEIDDGWRDFFALHTSSVFWTDIVRVFGASIRARFPTLEDRVGRPLSDFRSGIRGLNDNVDLSLECQFVINTPGTQTSSVKTPHVDRRQTIFAGLFYLRDPQDRSEGGDLELYRWKREPRFLNYRMILPDDVEQTGRVPYAENMLACFVNSSQSVHGVSPRGPSRVARRYINLIAEVPFHAFKTPRMSLLLRPFHWKQLRQVGRRKVPGDRY